MFSKSEVFQCFVKFKLLVEKQFSTNIKQFQSDNGGEYTSTQFKQFFRNNGILHRLTCPHTSQQNGVAKRKHRHVVDLGLTLLAQAGLPPKYWVDSFLTTTYLINRLPTHVLNHKSPFSKLFGKSPDYTLLRSFGCLCYPLLRPYAPHKLSFRSKSCLFLGYCNNQHGYRCLDPQSHKVYISRHVVFDESTFPAKDMDLAHGFCTVTTSSGIPLFIPTLLSSSTHNPSPTTTIPHTSSPNSSYLTLLL